MLLGPLAFHWLPVAAFIATASAQVMPDAACTTRRGIAGQCRPNLPKLDTLTDTAEHVVLACVGFPADHRTRLHATNPLEKLNGEIKRRTRVAGVLSNEVATTRLAGSIRAKPSRERAVQPARQMTLEPMTPVSNDSTVMLSAVSGT